MVLGLLCFYILQITVGLPIIVQILNYGLLVINTIYTIIITVFIVPTYREHKLLIKDYNDRHSPNAVIAIKELKDKEKEEFKEIITTLKELKHDVNQLRQDKINLSTFFKQLNDISDEIYNLKKSK